MAPFAAHAFSASTRSRAWARRASSSTSGSRPSKSAGVWGARMFEHAVATLRADSARVLRIASDPYAEGFYLRMGARRVGEWPSTPSGRTLPLFVLEVGHPRGRGI